MKQIIIITLLLLGVLQNGVSQESVEDGSRLNVTIMPLSLVDVTPRLRLGLEYIANEKLVYGMDVGIGNQFLNQWRLNSSMWGQDYAFFEIRPEVKYIYKNRQYRHIYAAVELFYLDMKDFLESGRYERENSSVETTYESARFHKQKYGFHLKVGTYFVVSNRLTLDVYSGFGVAKRTISYTDVVNPVDGINSIFVEWIPQNHLFEGESTSLHMALGVKVGYTIWTKNKH